MSTIGFQCMDRNGQGVQFSTENLPDLCPICHHAITLAAPAHGYFDEAKRGQDNFVQLWFWCPRISCQNVFISLFRAFPSTNKLVFVRSVPSSNKPRDFSEAVKKLSSEFCAVYNESLAAEAQGLLKICGGGYRKSLEFLVKDYLIKNHPSKAEEIKKEFLGKCIQDHITNENIKSVAKRAVWLGNDEVHYLKKWEDKDLRDLKKLIDLTVHWIEMEELTKEAITDMPEEKKSS